MKKLCLCVAALISTLVIADTAPVTVSDAFVRVPIAGQKNSAAFMTLHNHGTDKQSLVAVETSLAETAELHSHTMTEGMMRMRREASIDIAPGSRVHLEPGSLHIMLFNLQHTIRTGDTAAFTLIFADGRRLPVTVPVKSVFDNDSGHQHHH
ncbi:MAG TPA: copper chaperone PCu(A)C [Cellvibrionaceae bacterium]